ncbi:PD-XK nuclease superfamily-domain-containing protein [Tribonema minus]|uniref:PD-XK nuclease superfamily-domain-containing protein n=1 Tax=Tribonema minus TaxID=303371 RepID=A0A835ZAM2_9STRA|nr:PD-XK nuclease superfamily-domain-containing protein [Tribonema minus]
MSQLLVVTGYYPGAHRLRAQLDLARPMGCIRCEVKPLTWLMRAIVDEYAPLAGLQPREGKGYRVMEHDEALVFLHRRIDALSLGPLAPRTSHALGEDVVATAVRNLHSMFDRLGQCGVTPEAHTELWAGQAASATLILIGADHGHYLYAMGVIISAMYGARAIYAMSIVCDSPGLITVSHCSEPAAVEQLALCVVDLQATSLHCKCTVLYHAAAYAAYAEMKVAENMADFYDQLLLAQKVLAQSASAREAWTAQFRGVFLDDLHTLSPVAADLAAWEATGRGDTPIIATADPYMPRSRALPGTAYDAGDVYLSPLQRFLRRHHGARVSELLQSHRHGSLKSLEPVEVWCPSLRCMYSLDECRKRRALRAQSAFRACLRPTQTRLYGTWTQSAELQSALLHLSPQGQGGEALISKRPSKKRSPLAKAAGQRHTGGASSGAGSGSGASGARISDAHRAVRVETYHHKEAEIAALAQRILSLICTGPDAAAAVASDAAVPAAAAAAGATNSSAIPAVTATVHAAGTLAATTDAAPEGAATDAAGASADTSDAMAAASAPAAASGPLRPADIAVIVPQGRDVPRAISALAAAGVPVWSTFQSQQPTQSGNLPSGGGGGGGSGFARSYLFDNASAGAVLAALRCAVRPPGDAPQLLQLLQLTGKKSVPSPEHCCSICGSYTRCLKKRLADPLGTGKLAAPRSGERCSCSKSAKDHDGFVHVAAAPRRAAARAASTQPVLPAADDGSTQQSAAVPRSSASAAAHSLPPPPPPLLRQRRSLAGRLRQSRRALACSTRCAAAAAARSARRATASAMRAASASLFTASSKPSRAAAAGPRVAPTHAVQHCAANTHRCLMLMPPAAYLLLCRRIRRVAAVEPVLRLFRLYKVAVLPQNALAANEEGTGLPPELAPPDCVTVMPMTAAHVQQRAFHTVLLPHLTQAMLPGWNSWAAGGHVVPAIPGVTCAAGAQPLTAHQQRVLFEDNARSLLYAGVARATHCVVLTCVSSGNGVRSRPSALLSGPLAVQRHHKTGVGAAVAVCEGASAASPGVSDTGTQTDLKLSFSSINAFLRCPRSYYQSHVLNVTPPPTPLTAYGGGLHAAAAALLIRVRDAGARGAPQAESVEAAAEVFEGEAHARADSEDRQALIEHRFAVAMPTPGVELRGAFDRVDIVRGADGAAERVWVTDFKSHIGTKDPTQMAKSSAQLQLYAWAAQQMTGVLPSHLVIESIEDGRRGIVATGEDTAAEAEAMVEKVAQRIRTADFSPTPSFSACRFCGFKHSCSHSVSTHPLL